MGEVCLNPGGTAFGAGGMHIEWPDMSKQDLHMNDQRTTFLSVALLTTLLALSGGAVAQDSSKVVPANAQVKPYGSGWECKPGFRRDGAACAAIKLPANAYLSDDIYGPGWTCKREYKADGNSCVAVKLPQNAYLPGSSYSDDWECERGFRKAGAACVVVTVPKNGYLSDSSQSRAGIANVAFAQQSMPVSS
jgi:hypothetical protein